MNQTDRPASVDVYARLFRDHGDHARLPAGPPSWEPTVRVPEGAADFSWLYRPAEATATASSAPAVLAQEPTVAAPALAAAAPDTAPRGVVAAPAEDAGWPGAGSGRRWPAAVLVGAALASATLLWGWTSGLL